MTILRPVPGNPAGVRVLADVVEQTGHRLAAACTDLVRIRDGAVWDGPAGEAFSARVRDAPSLLDRAARRHLCAPGPLRAWADVLEEEQAAAQRCVTEHDDARDAYVVLEDRVYALVCAGRGETDPEVGTLRALQQDQAATIARAQARHAAALERLRAEGSRVAAVLRGLAEDPLADGVPYRGLHTTSSTGHAVATVAAPLARWVRQAKAAAIVGDGLGTLADGALLVGYGEGSWGGVATAAGVSAAGFAGDAARYGAKTGTLVRTDGAVVRISSLSTQERLAAGAAATAGQRIDAARAAFRAPAVTAVRRGPRSGSRAAGAATQGSAVRRVVDAGTRAVRTAHGRARTELALVDAGGSTSRRMYAAGVTLTATSKAAPHLVPDGEPPGARGPTR